jgi:hypothetical protein
MVAELLTGRVAQRRLHRDSFVLAGVQGADRIAAGRQAERRLIGGYGDQRNLSPVRLLGG